MTHTRTAKRFIRTNAAVTLGLALAFVAGGPWWLWGDGGRDPMVLVLWTIGAAVAVGGFIAVRYRRFRCPSCAGPCTAVDDLGTDEGAPLIRRCAACGIDWRLGER
jgi:hypothetical protein